MSDVMHPGEVLLDDAVVRRLVDSQLPQWAGLPLERIGLSGTVNVLYRLGEGLVLRLPRLRGQASSSGAFDRDREWLPRLAPLLPAPVPELLVQGGPGEGFPAEWAVYSWLPGEHPDPERLADPGSLARQLAGFIRALRAVGTGSGPESGRGSSLERWDEPTRAALRELEGSIDTAAALAAWERALAAPPWKAT